MRTQDNMIKSPAVSVIIPTYNRANLLPRALKSVLSQTFRDFEVIVVDDASTDTTEVLMKDFTDEKVKYMKHKTNKGANAARNTGLKIATGKYIAFQDSDDEWEVDKLRQQISILDATLEVGAVYTAYVLNKDGTRKYLPHPSNEKREVYIHDALLYKNFITIQTLVVRSKLLHDINGFDEKMPRLQDWELMLRLSKICRFVFINKPLVNTYYTADSISSNPNRHIQAIEYILKKHSEDFSKHLDALSEHYYNLGILFLETKKRHKAMAHFYLALKTAHRPKYAAGIMIAVLGSRIFNSVRTLYKVIRKRPID